MDEVLRAAELDESAPTTGRRSARSQRMEIITRGECRRRWTVEQKRDIVAESLGPELTPTEVARKHAISSGQLYTWRRQLLSLPGAVVARPTPRFAAVDLASVRPDASGSAALDEPIPGEPPAAMRPEGMIEIMLPGGVSLRVDTRVDGGALRRVLDALERR
jgi:transposase